MKRSQEENSVVNKVRKIVGKWKENRGRERSEKEVEEENGGRSDKELGESGGGVRKVG